MPVQSLLEPLLDAWDRNNTILLNLLHALPEGGLETRARTGSPSVAAQLTHIRDVRLFFVSQTAPEFAGDLPELFRQESETWQAERDPSRIEHMLEASAKAVREAVKSRVDASSSLRGSNVAYDHPILLLQHMLWHEGYHVGQVMLALKAAGKVMTDEETEQVMWSVWRREW